MEGDIPRERRTTKFIDGREALEGAIHAHLRDRSARPGGAGCRQSALAKGDIPAVAPFIAPALGAADEPLGGSRRARRAKAPRPDLPSKSLADHDLLGNKRKLSEGL